MPQGGDGGGSPCGRPRGLITYEKGKDTSLWMTPRTRYLKIITGLGPDMSNHRKIGRARAKVAVSNNPESLNGQTLRSVKKQQITNTSTFHLKNVQIGSNDELVNLFWFL
jgi:hypothetical protein